MTKPPIGGIRALGIRGCAISMPFKEDVIPLHELYTGIRPDMAAVAAAFAHGPSVAERVTSLSRGQAR